MIFLNQLIPIEHVSWKSQFDLPGIVWEKIVLKEGQMPNIKAHSAIKLNETSIFIFGGYDQKGECTNTSLVFDTGNLKNIFSREQRKNTSSFLEQTLNFLEKLRIVPFETKGKKPGPRAFHVNNKAIEYLISIENDSCKGKYCMFVWRCIFS